MKKYFVEKAFFSELFARFVSEKTPGCLVRPHGKPPAVKLRVKGFVAVAVGIGVLAIVGFVISHFVVEEAPYSNIHPEDYVGPETCGSCHEKNYEMWKDHSHRKMNLTASEESVLGDFSGIELQYGRGHAKFHRVGTDFVMSIFEGGRMTRRHKVTRTVGSLYMQYYVGTQVFGPEPKTHLTYKLESKLPFAYLFPTESWVPEVYLDSTSEPDELYLNGKLTDYIYDQPPVHNWNTTCMTCHNTYPYIMRLWHLPPPYDEDGLWQGGFPESDVSLSGPSLHQGGLDLGGGVRATHPDELVTVGISCESCHFGGREHAINGREIRFVPTGPEVSVATSRGAVKSDRKDPYVVNSICRQCHNSELLLHPNQASAINSDEAMDLSRGACKSEIKCTDCHNPHRRGPGSGAPDQPQHIAACLRCHEKFKEPAASLAHTRHPANSNVSCLDCHMPRFVAGLDSVTRTHRISSPSEEEMLVAGGPNACNLCHLEQPITWTLEQLETGWKRPLAASKLSPKHYGEKLAVPTGVAWLSSKNRFFRLAATEAYARSPLVDDPVPFLLHSLKDAYAFNRTFALLALQRVLDRRIGDEEYRLVGPRERREKQVEKLQTSGVLSAELKRKGRTGRGVVPPSPGPVKEGD